MCSRSGESAVIWSRNATKCTASFSSTATTTESTVAIAATATDSATNTTATNAAVTATAASESLNLCQFFLVVLKVSVAPHE